MGWSLSYQPVRESELVDAYLLAVGKAIYIASNFERKCQWILRLFKLAKNYTSNTDLDTFEVFAKALRDNLLGPTLRGFATFEAGSEEELMILGAGKDARNFIAHEAAALGPLFYVGRKQIEDSIEGLKKQLDALITADNLVSKWVYEIEEKEPAPSFIQQEYPSWVRSWVLQSLNDT